MDNEVAPSGRIHHVAHVGRRAWRFSVRVLAAFVHNRGFLLAGGVGYNVLLSIVPLLAVAAWALSYVVDEALLLGAVRAQARAIAPGHVATVIDAAEQFLAARDLLGVVGFLVLLFFSSVAFRMLDDALAIIFQRNPGHGRRSMWLSTLLPFGYVLLVAIGILALTAMVAWIGGSGIDGAEPGADHFEPSGIQLTLLYASGLVGLGLLFTSMYTVLPAVRVRLRRALVGGFVAAVLWTTLVHALVYYFEKISLIDTVYGSFATVIVVLLTLELGAIILLLGAQVIAELERGTHA